MKQTASKLRFTSASPVPGPVLSLSASWPPVITPTTNPISEEALLQGILKAQTRVYDVCVQTPLQFAPRLSAQLGNRVYLKREDQQPVFSFKLRGAYNKMASLTEAQLKKGIVTCSAGNHAQGVALSAKSLGINNVIVMPKATPAIKVDAVKNFGGNAVLFGDNFDQAQTEAMRLSKEEGRTLVHPFDDVEVICGQATIGIEISKQLPRNEELHAVFCCVGGGGLLAGVASYLKRISPEVQVFGVEACDAACMTRSFEAGKSLTLPSVGLFADGAAVRTPGKYTFDLCRAHADGMITNTTDEICQAIKAGFNDCRTVMEPAGALGIAGLVRYVKTTGIKNKTLIAVTSGANMDFDRLRFVSERADVLECFGAATIPERPGSFWDFYMAIFPRNVTEFSYRMISPDAEHAHVLVGWQTSPNAANPQADVLAAMQAKNIKFEIIGEDDELSKTHLRHMVGGRAPTVTRERVFRFEFPERPGALKEFLEGLFRPAIRPFNITLFHYRSHGADVGRVFAGFSVRQGKEEEEFEEFLADLCSEQRGFSGYEETGNQFYQSFLH
ncbi:threonine ammonia-lyase, biosynthetic [Batrachochytrium salamandrivorans]|nr:threonine ammonia-lyase, biosynthetic [Batrachochytrium salamandrivorans]